MYTIHGIAVSTGIGIGKARILKEVTLSVSKEDINPSEIEQNIDLFNKSIQTIISEIDEFIGAYHSRGDKKTAEKIKNQNTKKNLTEDESIIETHKMILLDPEFHKEIKRYISEERMNLEKALYTHFTKTIDYFNNLNNELYADRAVDYDDVYRRLLMRIKKIDTNLQDEIEEGDVAVLDDIPPSMVSPFHKKGIAGIALRRGTKTSHSVIIARALGIPIITGIKHSHKIHNEDVLIIDAKNGKIIGNPTTEIIVEYQILEDQINHEKNILSGFKEISATTADCELIQLFTNIELPFEIDNILDLNTDGIGLFRTEFFYLDRKNLPEEVEQYEVYKMIAKKLGDKQFTIRTIDIGGDKVANWFSPPKEENPYLGCRGIRFSLKNKTIFKTQLLAILRASVYGKVQIMFPMIASIEEFIEAKEVLEECKNELRKKNIDFNEAIPIGTMIEIPSAAINSEILAKHSDFFSIGTNDLLQYTVAVDRNNETIANYYNPYSPAFLQLMMRAILSAKKYQKPVSICGELGNDHNFTAFLLCLGVREISVGSQHILGLKKHIRSINIMKGIPFLEDIQKCETIKDTELFINRLNNICIHNTRTFLVT
ncbi:MAG: phosphoenolpyruvate--protein phosphotransferase [Candidatus Cloacimonetes bacterium]|nr:phosphoenolpyruvate--protein phosphotransferase [Candidatus Cloacimonadota bacterium]